MVNHLGCVHVALLDLHRVIGDCFQQSDRRQLKRALCNVDWCALERHKRADNNFCCLVLLFQSAERVCQRRRILKRCDLRVLNRVLTRLVQLCFRQIIHVPTARCQEVAHAVNVGFLLKNLIFRVKRPGVRVHHLLQRFRKQLLPLLDFAHFGFVGIAAEFRLDVCVVRLGKLLCRFARMQRTGSLFLRQKLLSDCRNLVTGIERRRRGYVAHNVADMRSRIAEHRKIAPCVQPVTCRLGNLLRNVIVNLVYDFRSCFVRLRVQKLLHQILVQFKAVLVCDFRCRNALFLSRLVRLLVKPRLILLLNLLYSLLQVVKLTFRRGLFEQLKRIYTASERRTLYCKITRELHCRLRVARFDRRRVHHLAECNIIVRNRSAAVRHFLPLVKRALPSLLLNGFRRTAECFFQRLHIMRKQTFRDVVFQCRNEVVRCNAALHNGSRHIAYPILPIGTLRHINYSCRVLALRDSTIVIHHLRVWVKSGLRRTYRAFRRRFRQLGVNVRLLCRRLYIFLHRLCDFRRRGLNARLRRLSPRTGQLRHNVVLRLPHVCKRRCALRLRRTGHALSGACI